MFGNTPQGGSAPNNNPTSLFSNSSSGLFGNTNTPSASVTPTGGLFGSLNTNNSLFGNNNNSQLKTSVRKQGGLFSNIATNKDPKNQQAPKLGFPGLNSISNTSGNSLFGGNKQALSINANKQVTTNTPSLFANNNTSGLFSGSNTGGLFGNSKPATNTGGLFGDGGKNNTGSSLFGDKGKQQGQQQKSEPPKGGLFANINKTTTSGGLFSKKQNKSSEQPPKQNKPGLFSLNSKQQEPTKTQSGSSLFGGNTSSLFGKVNQTSSLFGNSNQTPSLFNSVTPKTQNKNQSSQANRRQTPVQNPDNSSTTSNTPLFGNNTLSNSSKQIPKISSIGNVKAPKDSNNSSVLDKYNQSDKSISISKTEIQHKSESQGYLKGQYSRLNQVSQKPKQTSLNGSLFSGIQEVSNIQKKQYKNQGGSFLFGNKASENKKIQQKSTLFTNNTSLFGNVPTITNSSQNKQMPVSTQKTQIQSISKQTKASSGLLATFSNQQNQPSSRQTRTISFNQNPTQNPPQLQTIKPASSLFSNTNTDQAKKSEPLKPTITQSHIRPSNQPVTMNKSKNMMQQSFFKTSEVPKSPSVQAQIIYTSFQINKLFNKTLLKKSTSINQSRNNPLQLITKQKLINISQWINLTFTRYNQVPTSEMLEKKFTLHQNQDINKFMNDLFKQVVVLVNLPYQEKSFKLVQKLFDQILEKLAIKQTVFSCARIQKQSSQIDTTPTIILQPRGLNSAYFLKHQIYKFTPQSIQFNLESQELQQYVYALIKKFITNQLEYLQLIQNRIQFLRLPSDLYYNFLTYCLKYKKFRISSSNVWNRINTTVISLIVEFQKKIIQRIVSLLTRFVDQNFYSFAFVDKKNHNQLIDLIENFSYVEEQNIIHLSLKTILNSTQLGSTTNFTNISTQFKNSIRDTKSLQLLPFRTLLSIIQNKSQRLSPSAHDLYKYVSGPQWIDWLEICLSNTNSGVEKQISPVQAKYLIRILKYPSLGARKINRQKLNPKQIKYIENLQKKILVRKRPIYKFIMALKQENMLNMFYDILASLIYDYDSYRRIQQLFFKQKDEINYEFKNLIAQICNYPTQQFKQQIPFMEEKIHYFLRIVEVAPQKTLLLQRLIFEGASIASKLLLTQQSKSLKPLKKIYNEQTEVGHKICHLIIDTTNYFGLKNNQLIVSKCISAIKSLLQKPQTSLAMKIAMAINKPSILFSSSPIIDLSSITLSQSLIKQMTQLLQYFLISDEFTHTVSVRLHTNNSEIVQLQRMYSVRYSDKDYLPFVKEIIDFQENTKLQKFLHENQQNLKQNNIILTYSSYWFLKALQVFVRAFKQQKITSGSNQRKLLYLLNLILQKFFVLPSNKIQNLQDKSKMLEESVQNPNGPIYAISSSVFIPKIYQYLTEALNAIDILPILNENLKYKILRSGYVFDQKDINKKRPNYVLTNSKLEQDFNQYQFNVFLSVKILKRLLETYRLYQNYKNKPLKFNANEQFKRSERNFMYKLLSKLKCIQQLEFSMFLKGYDMIMDVRNQESTNNESKTNLVIGLIALLIVDNQGQKNKKSQKSDFQLINQSKPINLKQQNYERPYIVPVQQNGNSYQHKKSVSQLSNFQKVQKFYSNYGESLNYQSLNNFLVLSPNKYIQSYESMQCLAVSCLSLLISGQELFGEGTCDKSAETTINVSKYVGIYNLTNLDINSNELFSNQWLLQKIQTNLSNLLLSKTSTIQLKHSILSFILQLIKNQKSNSNFLIGKKLFYQYVYRHFQQDKYYFEEQFNRINLIVIKILNILEEKDYQYLTEQVHDKFLDGLLSKMIANCSTCIKSANQIIKLLKSFKSKQYYQTEFSYFHLERTAQQREIIKVGQSYQLLKQIIILIQKRFFDQNTISNTQADHRWRSIKKVNQLIINLNLSYLTSIMIDQQFSPQIMVTLSKAQNFKQSSTINPNLPRSFSQNAFQVFLIEATHLSFVQDVFQIYKQNILDWISYYSIQLCQVSLKLLTWILTVDKNLYGNQPNQIKSWQLLEKKNSNIICSLHMGSYKHNAIQLFADSQGEAINVIKNLYDESFKNLQNGMAVNQIQTFSILGYALEWLRARNNTDLILQHLVRSTIKHNFWINNSTVKNSIVVKFILSLASIGKRYLHRSQFKQIKQPIINAIHSFKQGKSQIQQVLIQSLLSVLISIPPEIEDSRVFKQILAIWKTQTNNEFFYNEARLVLQMAMNSPNELAFNKILTDNRKLQRSSSHTQYIYNLRNPDSISFIWALKIASTMMSTQQQTISIIQQVSQFYSMKRQYITNFLIKDVNHLTLGYLEQLQALLEFLFSLFTSKSWLIVQRKQFEKLTYILTHKLINVFNDFMNSKLNYIAQSDMQQRFKKIRFEVYVEQSTQNIPSQTIIDKDSVFKMLMQMKMIKCMKTFINLLNQSLQQSWYIHKYFNEEVYQNYRYGVSFWDRINKMFGDFIRFNVLLLKKWKKTANLNQKLLLIKECINCSQYFVQSGYLSSILDVPYDVQSLFGELYELNLESLQLGTVHLVQQKSFRQKYQCLMKGNIQKYAKRLIQNVKSLTSVFEAQQNKTLKLSFGQLKRVNFQKIQKNLTHLLKSI